MQYKENEKFLLVVFFEEKKVIFLWVEQALNIKVGFCSIGTCRWAKWSVKIEIAATFNHAASL